MKKSFTLIIASLFMMLATVTAQSNLDFETPATGSTWTWVIFENGDNNPSLFSVVENPDQTGINSSANVGRYITNSTGQPWAGMWSEGIDEFTFSEDNKIVKVMVYKDVVSDFTLKFENQDVSVAFEVKVANTVTNQWEELEFDFSEHIGKTVARLVVIPDFPTARTAGSTNYFDNLYFSDGTHVSIAEKAKTTLSYYPNPVTDNLTVSSGLSISAIKIESLAGSQLFYQSVNNISTTIKIGDLPSGTYLMSVQLENGDVSTHKIIKL